MEFHRQGFDSTSCTNFTLNTGSSLRLLIVVEEWDGVKEEVVILGVKEEELLELRVVVMVLVSLAATLFVEVVLWPNAALAALLAKSNVVMVKDFVTYSNNKNYN